MRMRSPPHAANEDDDDDVIVSYSFRPALSAEVKLV